MRQATRAALVITLTVSGATLWAATTADDGSQKRARVEGYVAAFNSGDTEVMLGYFEEALTTEARKRRSDQERRISYERMSHELGKLTPQKLDLGGRHDVTVTASSEKGLHVMLGFDLEEGPPFRIESIGVRVGPAPSAELQLPPVPKRGALSAEAWAAELDGYLETLAEKELFSGSVLLARGDEIRFQGAYGLANRAYGVANSEQTRFGIGSITKILTKTAIGQLARDGKLELSDTILDHLPDYPNPEVGKQVTIDHLLTMTSGLGDIFVESFMTGSKARFRDPEDFFELFADEPLAFEPGEGRQYSNAGYIVLGAIIAAASGQGYGEYLASHVLEPAGMSRSGFFPKDVPTPDLAVGYTQTYSGAPGEWRANTFLTPIQGCPAGGLYATAEDLWKFDRALRQGRLLGPGWSEWVFTGSVPDAAALAATSAPTLGQAWAIAGGAWGVNALLDSSGEHAGVVLANLDPPIAMDLGRQLVESLEE